MRFPLLALVILPLVASAQWQSVPVPVTTTLHSIDSYDAQRLCIGTPGSWLSSTDGGSTWVELPLMDPLGFQLIGSAFFAMEYRSPTNIVGTGFYFLDTYPFQVRRSTDGGATWPTAYSIAGDGQFSSFNGMAFSGSNGVAVGALGRIIRSTTDGLNWATTNSTGNTLRDVAWPNATTVVVVGDGRIMRSTNSGQAWTTVWTGSADLRAVSFPSSTAGFAAGTGGDLLRTNDGGATWAPLGAQLPDGLPYFTDIWFTSTTEGYATADELILRTTDGGLHWAWYDAGEQLWQLHFQSPTNGFAVAANGLLLRTAPGAYRPYALFDGPLGQVCHATPTAFTDQSGPGVTRQWLINGQPVSTDAVLNWTFTEPSQQDTVTLVVDNGTYTDTLERVVNVGATLAIVNNALVLTDTVCSGQSTQVQVPASQALTTYRLWRGGTAQGNAQSGNGNTLIFPTGNITADQLFHLVATRNLGTCGTVIDTVSTTIALGNPTATLPVSPGALTVCKGDTITIGVEGTQAVVSYQLRRNGIALGAPQAGTGGLLEFEVGPITQNATYAVFATHTQNGCTSTLQQTVPVSVEVPAINWGATAFNPVVGTAVDLMNGSNTLGGTFAWTIPGGTPATSTEAEPQGVVFNVPGSYPVQLIGITPQGCRDTLVQMVHAIAQPEPQACGVSQLSIVGGSVADAAVALDAQGNMYGWVNAANSPELIAFSGGADSLYEDLPSATDYGYNGALVKFDTYGVPQWLVNFWHDSNWAELGDVVVDADGNVYTAYFHSEYLDSLRIVDASGTRTTINPPHLTSQQSVVITSFTPQGRLRWVNTFLESYATEEVNMELDGLGHLLVQGTNRMAQYDRATGEELWLKTESYGFRDITVTPDDHFWVTDRFNLVMREYASDGTLLQTTPSYTPTPPPFGLTRLNGWEAACDAAGSIYQLHNIQGQVVIGDDTLTGPGTNSSNQYTVYFFAKRGPAGEVLWTRTFEMNTGVRRLGMVVNGERVFLSVVFMGSDTLRMQGLDPLPMNTFDTWMLSYDLNGGSPQAVRIYDHAGGSTSVSAIPGPNALALSPDAQRMALWATFGQPLIAGTDTAFTYAGWGNPSPFGTSDLGLVFGAIDCLLPGLPTNTLPPQAFFAPPEDYCAGQVLVFEDASLYGPTAWLWQFPGGVPETSTEATPVVTYPLPGTYEVTLVATNSNGESTPYSAEVMVDICSGIVAPALPRSWRLWPTPTADVVYLQGPSAQVASVMDLQGRTVWSGTVGPQASIDMRSWAPGTYVLQIAGERLRVVVAR
jgi:photosystem II stability/assembly factor-like uncharacterized protein